MVINKLAICFLMFSLFSIAVFADECEVYCKEKCQKDSKCKESIGTQTGNQCKCIEIKKAVPNSTLLQLLLIGIFISFQINSTAFAIAIVASLALIAYSGFMKKLKFFGNFIVAIGTGATLIYGAAATGNIFSTFYLAALAMLANYGRELTKDIEDIEGDSGKKVSLPMVLGIGKTKIVAYASYFAAVYLSYFIYFDKIFGNLLYLAIITVSNFMLLKSLLLLKKNNFSASQKFSKFAMAAALVSFVAGLVKFG